ncbi:MAG: sigma-54-dependent Fis family transcriptional regulator [Pseudomonadota bacterium]|nr:MAG: sigma-54-dependent Fis family transcriptional regulator [Pseudomonadota bacterium]
MGTPAHVVTDVVYAGAIAGDADERSAQLLASAAILVVDDEPGMRNFLQRALGTRCALLELADSAEAGEALRKRYHFDLMIVDIRLPGRTGVDWMRELREQGTHADVIFMTAYADLDVAIAALRVGACDFVLKPFRVEQMLTSVRRCLMHRQMQRENFLLRRQVDTDVPMRGIIGENEKIREIERLIARVAPAGSTVLIEGETGSGKELVARAIHEASGRRGPFVAVNCGSISPDLLESELFGHTRGAFTGAQSARDGLFSYAHNGTVFLDEIGEMPLVMQAKLLRVLEQRTVRPVGSDREAPVDCRVIAATNRDLEATVREGGFREDLYYRLNVLSLTMPPLRERIDDIPMLAEYFSSSIAAEMGVEPIPFDHNDLIALQRYEWPGNVRELKNVIERSLLLGKFPADCFRNSTAEGDNPLENMGRSGVQAGWTLAEMEKRYMLSMLESAGGNKSETARRLGVSRKTLERKLHAWHKQDTAEV